MSLGLGQQVTQGFDLGLPGAFCRRRTHRPLHVLTKFGQVGQGNLSRADQHGQALGDAVGVGPFDHGAAAHAQADLDEPLFLQHPKGLPDRPAADPEKFAKLALRRQPLAHGDLAVEDSVSDLIHHILENPVLAGFSEYGRHESSLFRSGPYRPDNYNGLTINNPVHIDCQTVFSHGFDFPVVISITGVKPSDDYKLSVTFESGLAGTLDIKQ